MNEVVTENRSLLKATGLLALFSVFICSTALYYTEHWNPDPEIVENFGSVPRAFWSESINLHGQWVWCDFTALGKGLCAFIAFFSISICVVPMAVFTNGFYQKLLQSTEYNDPESMESWYKQARPESLSTRQKVYDVLYWHLHRRALGSH